MRSTKKVKAVRLFLPLSLLLPVSMVSAYGHEPKNHFDAANFLKQSQKFHDQVSVNAAKHNKFDMFAVTAVAHKGLESVNRKQDQGLNLDLSRTAADITLNSKFFHGSDRAGVSINRAGAEVTLAAGSKVTAAEFAAFQQAKNGSQTILLDASGAASGGSVNLNGLQEDRRFNLTGLVIPKGVDAFYSASQKDPLTVFGSISNYGNLYSLATTRSLSDARIFADSINNAAGAGMSTIVSAAALQKGGFSGTPSNLGFSLFGTNSIANAGSITSAGNLTLATNWLTNSGDIASRAQTTISARGSVVNAATGRISGQTGVGINAGLMQNAGAINSPQGAIAIAGGANSLNITGNGTINSPRGITFTSQADFHLQGANLTASQITFVARNGTVSVEAGKLDGKVRVKAIGSSIAVNAGALDVESVDVSGDPIFVSNTDSVILPASLITGGAPVTAIAARDILGAAGSGTTINTSAPGGGGDVFLLAGAISGTINGITTVYGASGYGGSIAGINSITTSGDKLSKNTHGGNITLGAYGGTITTGDLTANAGTTGQAGTGVGNQTGRILVFSPGDIKVGNLQTAGTHVDRTVNFIYIANADPNMSTPFVFDAQGGKTQGSLNAGSMGTGSVTTGILDSGLQTICGLDAGSISVQSGGSINTKSIIALGGGGGGNYRTYLGGYDASGPGGSSGNVFLSAANGNVFVDGDLNTSGAGGGGSNYTSGGRGGNGGNVTISASGNIIINGPLLTPGGGGGGGSGISSTDTAGGGASFGNGAGPNSGALYKMIDPYNGPGTLDRGVVPSNPNNPRFPLPGLGGTNTAYDYGCCGGGWGGDVGNYGNNGWTGTFQRGWWDDTSPHPGGAPGLAGNITLTGQDIQILKTIGTYYGTTHRANESPYANYSLFAHSQLGGGIVTITANGSKPASNFLNADGNFESTSATVQAQIRPAQVTIAGASSGNSVTVNGVAKPGVFNGGVFAGTGNSPIKVIENGAQKSIANGQYVTPSEWAAVLQVGNGIGQTISLSAGGAAAGGNYTLTANNTPQSGFSQLIVPLATNFYAQLPALNVQNQALVKGNLSFNQSSTLSASSIALGDNARIESTGAGSNLVLSAPNFNLGNSALIASSGNLSLGTNSASGLTIAGPSGGSADLKSATYNISLSAPNGALSFASAGAGAATLNTDRLQMSGQSVNIASSFLLAADDAITANLAGGPFLNLGTVKSVLANGSGGSITVRGTGDLSVQPGNLIVASSAPPGGAGGTLDLSSTGILTLSGSGLNASATGSGDNQGGAIYLAAVEIINQSGLPFVLTADATGNGNGGLISISKSGAAGDIKVNSAGDAFNISARGGSTDGDGGEVRLAAGRDIFIDVLNLNASAGGSNGAGARYTFRAGTAGSGDASIAGSLDVSGHGTGAGGNLSLTTNSANALNLGNASGYGLHGQVTADGGTTAGAGGQIFLENLGPGGINISAAADISAKAHSGKGGRVTLSALSGDISLPGLLIDAEGGGSKGDGGNIILAARHLSLGSGGPLILKADGSGAGNGGCAQVTASATDGDISLANSSGHLLISATGGSNNSAAGDGGTVSLTAGRDINIDAGALTARPLGSTGNGAHITLSAGNAASGVVYAAESLDASAASQGGAGGSASISYNSTQTFALGAVSTNGINGSLMAGSQNGAGGSISIDNKNTAALNISNDSAISAGDGTITLSRSGGSLSVAGPGSIDGHLTLVGNSVSVATGVGDLNVDLASAQSGSLNLQASGGALRVNQSASASGQNTIGARDQIELDGSVGGTIVSLNSASAGITVNNNVLGSTSISLSAHGAGNIVRNAGVMSAPTMQMTTESGDITNAAGTAAITGTSLALSTSAGDIGGITQALNTNVSTLSASTGNTGIVNIANQNTGALNLLACASGGDFSLATGGALTINGIITTHGSIQTQNGSQNLLVAPGAQVIANDGNISLIDNNVGKKATIRIDAGATVKASSLLPQFGHVYIGFAAPPAVPATGKLPRSGAIISTANGGALYLNKTKLALPSRKLPPAYLTADGRNIIFSSGAKGQNIEIGSAASIIADPPPLTIYAPKEDMQVQTPFGVVNLSAHSLVLMAASDSAVSIFDLDDTHKDAVNIESAGGKISLSPGRHITLNNAAATAFHDVNPIEAIAHRSVELRRLGARHIAHISEFHMPSAIDALPLLAQMVRGEHAHLKKQADHLLKTAAVLLQIGGTAGYQIFERPALAAYDSEKTAPLLPLNAGSVE